MARLKLMRMVLSTPDVREPAALSREQGGGRHFTSSTVSSIAHLFCFFLLTAVSLAADPPQTAVFVMNADGSQLQRLVQASGKRWHGNPSWSPDGQRLVFHAFPKDDTSADSHVFSVNADGTDVKDLGVGMNAAWSADGKQILFSIAEQNPEKAQVGLWIMNADGKGRQWILQGTSGCYAPDGSRILFVSAHEGNQSIYAYDLLESMPKKILQETYEKKPGAARWSPDGKRVAFIDERKGKIELIMFDAGGADKSPIVRHRGPLIGPVAWAPNGTMILCQKDPMSGDRQRLYSLNPDNEDSPEPLPEQDAGTYNFDPAWSPNGQKIVFISDRTSP